MKSTVVPRDNIVMFNNHNKLLQIDDLYQSGLHLLVLNMSLIRQDLTTGGDTYTAVVVWKVTEEYS